MWNKIKRINVQKIASLKDLFNKPVSEITFNIKSIKEIDKVSDLVKKEGSTDVKIKLKDDKNELTFKLKNKRFIDRKNFESTGNSFLLAKENLPSLRNAVSEAAYFSGEQFLLYNLKLILFLCSMKVSD